MNTATTLSRRTTALSLALALAFTGATIAPAQAAHAAATPTLTISGYMFGSLTVKHATRFVVVNKDTADHTMKVAGTKTDILVPAGKSVKVLAPAKAGSYKLTCDFHPTMHGVLKVK